MPEANRRSRVLVLWSRPSGYLSACLNALVRTQRAHVFFIGWAPDPGEAPFELENMARDFREQLISHDVDAAKLAAMADEFGPDIILAGGSWRIKAYRRVLRRYQGRAVRVLCSDTQKSRKTRQKALAWGMRVMRSRYYDVAFVAGKRQAELARMLGFHNENIHGGLYSCDYDAFASANGDAGGFRFDAPAFLFVGRLIERKGLAELLEAYRVYRERVRSPWPLTVCGTGPLQGLVSQQHGVNHRGFVQPAELPAIMGSHTTLIVPSYQEPWGLVLHEAVSSGMSVICTAACGAADAFVRDGENGQIIETPKAEILADALATVAASTPEELSRMSEKSAKLARWNTPDVWAQTVLRFGYFKTHRMPDWQ